MRTTIDLPDDLLRRAKIVAVERGSTLRELISAAVERELSAAPRSTPKRRRSSFPIFAAKKPGSLDLSNADLARMEREEDARRHGGSR